MNRDENILTRVNDVVAIDGPVLERAQQIAEIIREACGHRWVGIYRVTGSEIAAIAWTGTHAPAYLRFPADRGLSGAAVRSRATVVVKDVTQDPRYLTAFDSTRAEMIVPVLDPGSGRAVGAIDVESEHINAFTDEDRTLLEKCARLLVPLFVEGSGPAAA